MRSKNKTLQIHWDDFRLWKNKRPDQQYVFTVRCM